MLPEVSQAGELGTELGMKRGPAHLDIAFQGVKAVGKPDVDVDYHGARPNRAQGGLAERNWMLAQSPEEILVQQDSFLPKCWLVAR